MQNLNKVACKGNASPAANNITMAQQKLITLDALEAQ
jgi:hypothetical protein